MFIDRTSNSECALNSERHGSSDKTLHFRLIAANCTRTLIIAFLLTAFLGSLAHAQDNLTRLETAEKHLQNGQVFLAYRLALPEAESGNVEAMALLATIANYKDAPITREDAARWSELAAELGHAQSQWLLGNNYRFGRYGFEKNPAKSLEWNRKAAAQGHTWGHQTILELGRETNLVPRDELAASFEAIKEVAEAGDFTWMNFLGRNYLAGKGTARDLSEARRWFQRVIDTDSAGSTFKYDAYLGLSQTIRATADSLDDIERALDLLLIASSDQFCSSRTSTGNGGWECTSLKDFRETVALREARRCAYGFDQRRGGNPSGLFECDMLRAIAFFAEERDIALSVDTVAVRNGLLFVTTQTSDDWRQAARSRLAASHPGLTWNESAVVWQGTARQSSFSCEMDMAAARDLQNSGRVVVRAVLRNLNGTEPMFRCRIR